ncbi:MAG TPA: MerR family transcriptional regulator [Streptomyces sp.]|nr:MerR family transcriptional regulator [Streptomyces sp.]
MRSTGDGRAADDPYPLHGASVRPPAQPASAARDTASEQIGYRGPTACAAAGITYRQLDYWARTGLVEPSIRPAYGSGTQRLYSFRDVVVLKIVKRLLDAGVSLQNIRTAVRHLRSRGLDDLAQMTLMSDGATVYECSSPDEVVDLLQGGQGVFGIAVGVVWRDMEGALSQLHAERADTGETLVRNNPADELARRRNRAG